MASMKLLLLWSFSVQLFQVFARAFLGNETDRLSLLEFKAETLDPLNALSRWNDSVHFCRWPGITCSRRHHQRVTSLFIYSGRLGGALSPHIGNLSFLRRLDLENNSFTGQIPEEIGRLPRLQVLRLHNNSFSGKIPANLSRCSSLQHLNLDQNGLTGELFPPGTSLFLPKLKLLSITSNRLSGEVPSSVANLSETLEIFSAEENGFNGRIPNSFGQLKRVWFLSLGGNGLSGTIPASIFNLSSIQVFSVDRNRLHGELPSNLGSSLLPNLREFFFHTNRFTGSVPVISNASNLVNFQISTNRLTGKVPDFASLPNLKILGLDENLLGLGEDDDDNDDDDLSFLTSLVNLTILEVLDINKNNFGGKLPESISNFSRNLWLMPFGSNRIRGSIPTGIGNLVGLQELGFEDNRLSGPIPSSIGNLQNLYGLTLENNDLSGSIPFSLGNLTSLNRLSLALNNLGGFLPPSLGECKSLVQLSLSWNNISGPIPKEVIGLSSLSLRLDLSQNRFTGSIPREVGKLVNLGRLDISDNELSGEIPETLGDCEVLEYLSLGGNFLRGTIPNSFGSLKGIKQIDLSRNNLSGKIPTYFEDFRFLEMLNLSVNNFEGEIPSKGVFKNASAIFVTRNPRLCGGIAQLGFPKCPSNTTHNYKQSTKLIVSVVCGLVAVLLLALFSWLLLWSRKRTVKSVLGSPLGVSFLELSYRDLLKATDGFSSDNLIGSGSFGSVYKGNVPNEEESLLVAVKVLNLRVLKASKSFVTECRVLGSVKHRNVVKLVTACSSIDSKGDDFKALVYEFMVNGNLEEWLHRNETRLSFVQRINIAIDIANALDHLHNHSLSPIVHSDLKPSNILLDGDLIARVGDFGLARFLGGDASRLFSIDDQSISIGIRGSIGYIAPEYSMGSELSTEGDVYSYGIVLLEMFTGKRPTHEMFSDSLNLHSFVKTSLLLPERLFLVADSTLLVQTHLVGENGTDDNLRECLYSILEIGISCSEETPKERMKIGDVLKELERIRIAYTSHEIGD